MASRKPSAPQSPFPPRTASSPPAAPLDTPWHRLVSRFWDDSGEECRRAMARSGAIRAAAFLAAAPGAQSDPSVGPCTALDLPLSRTRRPQPALYQLLWAL